MPRKKKLLQIKPSSTKTQLTTFLNTLASAWFIAGVITPATLDSAFELSTFYRATISLLFSGISLLTAIRLAESENI